MARRSIEEVARFLRRPAGEVQEKARKLRARSRSGTLMKASFLPSRPKRYGLAGVARSQRNIGLICTTIETSPGPCPSTTEKRVIATDFSNTSACALFASGKMNGGWPTNRRPEPLAIPLRTSANWRPSTPVEEHARDINVRYWKLVPAHMWLPFESILANDLFRASGASRSRKYTLLC